MVEHVKRDLVSIEDLSTAEILELFPQATCAPSIVECARDADAIVVSTAIPDHNVELRAAKERGIQLSTTNQDKSGAFDGYIKVTVVTDQRERSVAGTVFSDGKPRFIQIKGINIDAEVGAHMLYTTNEDTPGIIGTLGQTMGENGVNIANFTLGRADRGGEAIALLYVDDVVPAPIVDKLCQTGMFRQVKPLQFDVA